MTNPTKPHVDAFANLMESRLAENRHKGDREGWLKEQVGAHLFKAKDHLERRTTLKPSCQPFAGTPRPTRCVASARMRQTA
jgi:hypothetical protein